MTKLIEQPKRQVNKTSEEAFHLLQIVKSNKLIQASYRLTIIEQQIILYAMCLIRENQGTLFPDEPVTITAKHFCGLFGGNLASSYAQLKEALDKLYNRSVTFENYWDDVMQCEVSHHQVRWISSKSYLDGAGAIRLVFSSEIVKQITRLETGFTTYKIKEVAKISSWSSIRIYELLVQYKRLKKRYFEAEELKAMLCMQDKYTSIFDFKKRVLDPAVEHINEYTDIYVKYVAIKAGKVIKGFEFDIQSASNVPQICGTLD
jgi:plasmid replication initiation protein